ncbi:MAG TPA: hypothetical protein VJZ24_03105 [Thermodesulfovibrionales bacterium]|jgi:hypothetical protein|nr:hypothetical protein [Thermodesulfovibrionales bacterium]
MTKILPKVSIQIFHKFVDQSEQMQYRSGFTECSPPQAADTLYLGGTLSVPRMSDDTASALLLHAW